MLKNVLPRVRLFDLMDRLRERSAVWVSGLAGCGKTCAVASYIEKLDIPCLWYEIDEGDADPATFVYYMGLATKKLSPRKRKLLPLLTPEYLPGLATFSRRFFEAVYGRLKSPMLFVFDNYQQLPHDSPTQTIAVSYTHLRAHET